MNNIGFVISHKNGEKRRALLPEHIINIKNVSRLFVEEGYGESLRISDEEYKKCGVNIVKREEALSCDIIVDVKLGDADYLEYIGDGKTLIGWAHAVTEYRFYY